MGLNELDDLHMLEGISHEVEDLQMLRRFLMMWKILSEGMLLLKALKSSADNFSSI